MLNYYYAELLFNPSILHTSGFFPYGCYLRPRGAGSKLVRSKASSQDSTVYLPKCPFSTFSFKEIMRGQTERAKTEAPLISQIHQHRPDQKPCRQFCLQHFMWLSSCRARAWVIKRHVLGLLTGVIATCSAGSSAFLYILPGPQLLSSSGRKLHVAFPLFSSPLGSVWLMTPWQEREGVGREGPVWPAKCCNACNQSYGQDYLLVGTRSLQLLGWNHADHSRLALHMAPRFHQGFIFQYVCLHLAVNCTQMARTRIELNELLNNLAQKDLATVLWHFSL